MPLGLTVLAYARVLGGEFQWDDFHSVVENAEIKDLPAFARRFGDALFHGGRPVTHLTFAVNHALGRMSPWGYHAVNLAIHLAAVALVFAFTRRVLRLAGAARPQEVALAVAGVFALHPLQTQAVSYVVQRAESLASALYLAALLLLLEAERRGRTAGGAVAFASALGVFVLGLGAKMILVTLPLAYLLVAAALRGEAARRELASWRARLAHVAPLAAFDAFFAWITLRGIEGAKDAGFSIPGLPASAYFVTQWRVVATYLRLLVWPAGQNVDWGLTASRSLGDPAVVGSGLLLAALAAAAVALYVRAGRRDDAEAAAWRVAAVGVLWLFLVLAPTSSVVPLADPLEEHRMYLASWGALVAVAVLAERGVARARSARRWRAAAAAVAVVWGALALVTHLRNAAWETRVALWTDAVAKAPANWRAHLSLGYAYNDRGEHDAAIREYRHALELAAAETPFNQAFIQNNLGAALLNAGRRAEALAVLQRALQLTPDDPDLIFNVASALVDEGDLADAERLVATAVRTHPRHAHSLNLLGRLRIAAGDPASALDLFQRALREDPDAAGARFNVGVAYRLMGRTADACAAFGSVARMDPDPGLRERAARSAGELGCPRS